MDSLINRIRRSVAQRGCIATLELCAIQLGWTILPRFRRTTAWRSATDAEFDRKYGVDTSGLFRPKPTQVLGRHWAFGCSYQPIEPQTFIDVLARQQIPFPDFTFLDLGSGKGRSLMLASLFPFRKVIGVEYCPDLNRTARSNVRKFAPPEQACSEIEIVDADAAEYPIPDHPLVLFLFNPFSQRVMSKVVQHMVESYERRPRRIIVIYFLPELASLWESSKLFARTGITPAIFDSAPASRAAVKHVPPTEPAAT